MIYNKDRKKIRNILRLSLSLAKANFKLRTEGSYLGILWYLLDPLLMFIVLFVVFSQNLGSEIIYFPIYLILGLIMFNFFSTVTANAVIVITSNAVFIKSIKIEPEALVLSLVFQSIYSHIFEIIIFIIFLVYFEIPLGYLIFYPVILFFFCLLVLGVAFGLATVGVYASDFNNIWKFITQLLFFASAIFYSVGEVSMIFALNPIFCYLEIARDLIIYQQLPDILTLIVAFACSITALVVGYWIFRVHKNKFAENL